MKMKEKKKYINSPKNALKTKEYSKFKNHFIQFVNLFRKLSYFNEQKYKFIYIQCILKTNKIFIFKLPVFITKRKKKFQFRILYKNKNLKERKNIEEKHQVKNVL